MRTAIVNVGRLVTGDWREPSRENLEILCVDGVIENVGVVPQHDIARADVVIDAAGVTAIPGLIDSHVHITFGDFTPRQNTVGYLESTSRAGPQPQSLHLRFTSQADRRMLLA